MRFSVPMVLVLLLAGCAGLDETVESERPPVEQPTDTETPTATCTMTGGDVLHAVPVEGNVSDGNVTDYGSLPEAQRDAFQEMAEGYYEARRLQIGDFPKYVRYNGTVYEPRDGGVWDEFC